MSDKKLSSISRWAPFLKVLEKQWTNAGADETCDAETGQRIWTSIVDRIERRRHNRRRVWYSVASAAAVITVAVMLSWHGIFTDDTSSVRSLYAIEHVTDTTVNGPCEHVLPDGSRVWIEKGASISISRDFGTDRYVSLTGNAIFDVTKQDGQLFTVSAGSSQIVVRGTCFSISDNTDVNITLFNGKVDFISSPDASPLSLKPSQSLTYSRSDGDILVKDLSPDIQCDNGIYRFSQVALPDILDFISVHYGVNIILTSDLADKNPRMTTSVGYDESLESFIDRICYVCRLDCQRRDSDYILTGQHE